MITKNNISGIDNTILLKEYKTKTPRKGVLVTINTTPEIAKVYINGKEIKDKKLMVDINSKIFYEVKLKGYVSEKGEFNVGTTNENLIVELDRVKIYGVSFSGTNPAGIRLNDAIGLSSTVNGKSDFDTMPIYKDIKRVVFNGKNGLPNTGDVMVQIPKFYFKREDDPNNDNYKWYVSNFQEDGFMLHPAFKSINGWERQFIYVGAYKTSNNNQSKTGTKPQDNYSIANFQNAAKLKGFGWGQTNWMSYGACQLLFTIEHATRNSQEIMKANYSGRVQNNGLCDSQTNSNMQISNTAMCWRGIENLYGNVFEFLDGCYYKAGFCICYNINNFNSQDKPTTNIKDNYIKVDYDNAGDQNIRSVGYDVNNPAVIFPKTHGGTLNKDYFCDYAYCGEPYAWVGSFHNTPDMDGLFRYNFYLNSTDPAGGVGSRLCYFPD